MSLRSFVAVSIGCIALVVGVAAIFWRQIFPRAPLASPLSRFGYVDFSPGYEPSNRTYTVLGFVPYWTVRSASISAVMTDVAYFALALDANGEVVESVDGEREQGWYRMQSDSFTDWIVDRHAAGQRVHITITGNGNDAIAELLGSQKNRQQAVFSLSQLLISYPFDAVQIDFEYSGEASPGLRANLVEFMRDLDAALHKLNPRITLTIAVFGSAPEKPLMWDIRALEPYVDAFVFMAYDYHVRSSPVTGPVAPIFGKSTGRWQHDIVSNLRSLLRQAPADKVLFGVPFYGYEWTATEAVPGATTYPRSGATATYERVQELLHDPSQRVTQNWDADALSPYVTFEDRGKTQVIYYEDVRSLGYKLDLVRQLGLRGIAIWAVGYEGEYDDLWNVIGEKLHAL